jgi:SAM-dependent methyltransferase
MVGVPTDNASAWDRFTPIYQSEAQLSTSVAHYGPDMPTEADLKLLGDLRGKRVVELGCGGAQCSIAFAKQGATAIGVDNSAEQLAYARRLCATEEVRVELRHADMAELAFLRADSTDLAFSSWSFQFVEDLNRVFRQVHRVLKVGAPLVFSLPHPAYRLVDAGGGAAESAGAASYFDKAPAGYERAGISFTAYPRTLGDLYMGLTRASYRVDLILEPEPLRGAPRGPFWRPAMERAPRALIVRARKEGN